VLYAIIAEDGPDTLPLRLANRPQHLARLEDLRQLGRLVIAGPHPAIDSSDPGPAGFSGSLIIAEFTSLVEAQAWADEDPYLLAGVYRRVAVKPFLQVFP